MKTVLPTADFVIEGYVDPTEPLRDEGPFGGYTGYYTLPSPHEMAALPISRGEPYPVFHITAITPRSAVLRACCAPGNAIVYAHDNDRQ